MKHTTYNSEQSQQIKSPYRNQFKASLEYDILLYFNLKRVTVYIYHM